MRLAKILGVTTAATLVVVVLVGAGSASATSTALCKVHEDPCSEANQVKALTLGLVGVALKLNSTADILCLALTIKGNILGLASPQSFHTTELNYSKCGTNAAHNNCESKTVEPPLFELLKGALNLGTLTALSGAGEGILLTKCTILGFVKIHCDYRWGGISLGVEGAGHSESSGNGMVTANNALMTLVNVLDGSLCPDTMAVDFLLEPSAPTYLTG